MPFDPALDAGQPALNASQRRHDRAVRTVSDGISVRLFCNNRKDHTDSVVGTEQPLFALEENDVRRIGII